MARPGYSRENRRGIRGRRRSSEVSEASGIEGEGPSAEARLTIHSRRVFWSSRAQRNKTLPGLALNLTSNADLLYGGGLTSIIVRPPSFLTFSLALSRSVFLLFPRPVI